MAAGRARNASQTEQAQPRARDTAQKPKRRYLPASERRRLIIEAAQKVFANSSLQAARTRELARAADVNQATLFEHFSSKEELFIAAVIEPLVEAMRGMHERAEAYDAATSAEEVLAVSEVSSRKHLETMIEIYPLLTAALFSDPEMGKKLYREHVVPLLKQRTDATKHLIKDAIDPELVTLASLGTYFAVAMDRAFTNKSGDVSEIARQVSDLIMFGAARDSVRD